MVNPDICKFKKRVSVIIPVYNAEKLLEQCLYSLSQQSLPAEEFEIIFINDVSLDKSLIKVMEFAEKQTNITVLNNSKRMGPGLSRNIGIKKAIGEYVYFLDADDYIDPITLEALLITAVDNNSDMVTAGYYRVSEDKEILYKRNVPRTKNGTKWEILKDVFSLRTNPMVCNRLIKKQLFIDHDIWFSSGLHEDVAVMPRLFFYANNLTANPEYYYYYVEHNNSRIAIITKEHIDGFLGNMYYLRIFVLNEAGMGFYRKIRGDLAEGLRISARLLLERIYNSYSEDRTRKRELLTYLYTKVCVIPVGYETVTFKKRGFGNLNTMFNIFKENRDTQTAMTKYDEYLGRNKEQEVINKDDSLLVNWIKQHNKLYRIIRFLRRVWSYPEGIMGKLNYLMDRSFLFLHTARKYRIERLKTRGDSEKRDISVEVLFFCDAAYHIRNAAGIIRLLRDKGISAAIIDSTVLNKRELAKDEQHLYKDINIYNYSRQLDYSIDMIKLKAAIYFNDWAPQHNKQIREFRFQEIVTIGIDEGVNDFRKLSEGFSSRISPYRTVEHVVLPGEFDTQFFQDRPGQFSVAGLPMLRTLYKERVTKSEKPLAIINANFTYGVLEYDRDSFIKTAVEGCNKAGIEYVITRHPADVGDFSAYKVSDTSMYDAIRKGSIFISRFSGAILESLALGKPCVYHNPHDEKVIKFQEPIGAYGLSNSSDSLADAIKKELKKAKDTSVREYSKEFMDLHVNISDTVEPAEKIVNTILSKIQR